MKNLAEKSLIVSLNISQWSARKYDRKITEEVNSQHQAKDAGRYNKLLVAKDALEEIQKVSNKIRNFHYDNTLPWSDTGDRLLPSTNYFPYVKQLGEYKSEFEGLVNKFVSEYPSIIDDAKKRLNGMFNPLDYPSDISDKFSIKTTFMPVPVADDFRVNLSEEEVQNIRESVEKELHQRFTEASRSIYRRIKEQLTYMHGRLIEGNAKFRNSLFENLKELIELLPKLNFAEDEKVTRLCDDLKDLYVDAESVRADSVLRSQKAKQADAILRKMKDFV